MATLWLGYKDLYATGMFRADNDEDTITVEWYLKVYNRWTSENRASQVNVNFNFYKSISGCDCKKETWESTYN